MNSKKHTASSEQDTSQDNPNTGNPAVPLSNEELLKYIKKSLTQSVDQIQGDISEINTRYAQKPEELRRVLKAFFKQAVQQGKADVVEALLESVSPEKVSEVVNHTNRAGNTVLMYAAAKGHLNVVQALLKSVSPDRVSEVVN